MRQRYLLLIGLGAAVWLFWWRAANPLPDGFQNEYLHVGNAYDLWAALRGRAWWQVRLLIEGNYWPPAFYLVPTPLLWLASVTRGTQPVLALVASNLLHLSVLLLAARELGRRTGTPWTPLLVLLCPGVFGALVRYEPNLAVIAWTAAGLCCLLRSDGLQDRRWTFCYGLCLALGLLLDRLSVAFFLLPALLPLLPGAGRRGWLNLGLALLPVLALDTYWYLCFLRSSADELLSQAPVGEIDSAGQVTTTPFPWSLAWYPLALLDSQAGPVTGIVLLLGLRGPRTRERGVLLASALLSMLFFTIIAKKQVFYTLPALVPLAALVDRPLLAKIGVAGGVWSFLALGLGWVPGGPWLPETWVAPRHTLASPPDGVDSPLARAAEALGPAPREVLVLSEDETLFEGFAVLAVRERWMWADVRGVVLDPQGSVEHLDSVDGMVWITPTAGRWPALADVNAQLMEDHHDPHQTPPVAEALESLRGQMREVQRLRNDSLDIVVFKRR